MRPRFEQPLPFSQEELLARVQEHIRDHEPKVHVQFVDKHIELLIDEGERHYWSPWLSVTIDAEGDLALLRGRFGPHPSVWTMFMSIHAFLIFVAISGVVYGLTLWSLGHSPWPLFSFPSPPC